MQIKAASGVRRLDDLLKVRTLGVTRIGATATAAILDEAKKRGIGEREVEVEVKWSEGHSAGAAVYWSFLVILATIIISTNSQPNHHLNAAATSFEVPPPSAPTQMLRSRCGAPYSSPRRPHASGPVLAATQPHAEGEDRIVGHIARLADKQRRVLEAVDEKAIAPSEFMAVYR